MRNWHPLQLIILLLGVLLGGALAWGRTAAAQPAAATAPAADAGSGFTYQGRLTRAGSALTDSCAMQFSLWDSEADGTQVGATETLADVAVTDGRFTALLNGSGSFGSSAFNGAARWLAVAVNCSADSDYTLLDPRQPLGAVPLAQTLRPGATIRAVSGSALQVEAESTSASSLVVTGQANNSAFPSLRVNNTGAGGYGVYVNKTNGSGVASFAANNGATGSGAAGYSANWYGVYGYTGTSTNNYGFYSPDNLYTRNINMPGAIMMIAQYTGAETLQPGDVVAFSGVGFAPQDASLPLPQVSRMGGAAGVAGVAHARFDPAFFYAPPEGLPGQTATMAGAIKSGDYLLVVVRGVAQVNVSAPAGSLTPGALVHLDALGQVTTGTSGFAGAVIGTALEAAAGGPVYIYVDPR